MKLTGALVFVLLFFACTKNDSGTKTAVPGNNKLSYGDTLFYPQSTEYVISPVVSRAGSYSAFPDDLNLDPVTGKITVSIKGKSGKASQTGLRYRVVFTSTEGKSDTAHLVIGGVNYQDKIFSLSQKDTLLIPIYNANPNLALPGGEFESSNNKLDINSRTGEINLKKSIEKGIFNDDPRNNAWRIVNIRYRTNDKSTSDKNNMDIVIYYYHTEADIPSNVSGAMRSHQNLLLGIPPMNIRQTFAPVDDEIKNIVFEAKPRPPCIIIIK